MQYIYLLCRTHEEAKRVMQNKHIIISKSNRDDLKIESLSNNIGKSYQNYREPENVIVIVTPPSSLEVVEELPKGEELINQVQNLVQAVT